MEDPINFQSAENSAPKDNKRKYQVWSILVGLFYAIPAPAKRLHGDIHRGTIYIFYCGLLPFSIFKFQFP